MTKNIEIELRGSISKKKVEELREFLSKNGEFIEKKKRLLIDYSTFLKEEGLENRKKDIRLRATNGIPEIIVKLGAWGGGEARKELGVKTEKGKFDELVQIYAALGYTKGIIAERNIEVYKYKNIEIALVEVPGHSYYFEGEKMAYANENEEDIKKDILDILEELGLKTWNDKEFFAYIRLLNKVANGVFDFKDYKEGYFKNKYNL